MNAERSIDIIAELTSFLKELKSYDRFLRKDEPLSSNQKRYVESLRQRLVRKTGALKKVVTELTGKEFYTQFGQVHNFWSEALIRSGYKPSVLTSLKFFIDVVTEAIGKLEEEIRRGYRDEQGNVLESTVPTNASEQPRPEINEMNERQNPEISGVPKAFIVHGGKSNARDKLCKFLVSLGCIPIIIEEQPKEGRSVNEQVEYYIQQADCAIILGTADDKELKDGKLYPRRNTFIEIGRFQEKFPSRIIYLLEEGASLPSNIGEKLYTRFNSDNMDEVFTTIVRELTGLGLLRAAKSELIQDASKPSYHSNEEQDSIKNTMTYLGIEDIYIDRSEYMRMRPQLFEKAETIRLNSIYPGFDGDLGILLEEALKEGKSIQFLIMNPDVEQLQEAVLYRLAIMGEHIPKIIKDEIILLKDIDERRRSNNWQGKLEVKLYRNQPMWCIYIYDDELFAAPYFYNSAGSDSFCLHARHKQPGLSTYIMWCLSMRQ